MIDDWSAIGYRHCDGGRKAAGFKMTKAYRSDCVVRSITIVSEKPYEEVFNEMMQLGIKMGGLPNIKPIYSKYLKNLGFEKMRCPRDENGKLIKLRDWFNAPERAVVLNSRHLTAVVRNEVRDIWDCRYRPVNTYWVKE